MDSEEFIIGLTGEELGTMMINFFDEIMVLYNLIGGRSDIHVSANDASSATFHIIADDRDNALRIYNCLNQITFKIYNIDFKVNMDLNDDGIIHVEVIRL